MYSFIILDKRCSNKMDQYRLQMLQWKLTNGYVLTREEVQFLLELTSLVNDQFDDWLDNNY